ncbi:MAG: TetR/AcrR family transcriptional regulator [Homoserinimonas sp.]|nr:TetR/AcrR family transcriptional regulator [Homoserinimonas sp.]
MTRPRFAKLPAVQQEKILRVALTEFGSRGFHEASLNRIIDESGISKGSMYYYFEGKGDLFAHVIATELEKLIARLGTFPDLDSGDADHFWKELGGYFLASQLALAKSPQLASILREWESASRSPSFQQSTREMIESRAIPWIVRVVEAGQNVGAIRSDVPNSLLIAVAMGLGQAIDMWLLSQRVEELDLPELTDSIMGMLRGAVGPSA